MPIRILPEVVAAQIAAGEVIERPASAVKELVENALDAGATQISVEVAGTNLSHIHIQDDGHGIPSAEISLALLRHATSKLSNFDDLYSIQTLGFRGEALASIASVSRLTLTSRHVDEPTGVQISAEAGQIISQQAVGTRPGTSVEVLNLFYNVPARRKFLKSDSTERRHISNFIMRYAMAYPDVRFSLHTDERESFQTSGNGELADVIIDTLGLEIFRAMIPVEPLRQLRPDLPPIQVYGYATNPEQNRANRNQIMLFINGRSIQDQRLTYAVVQAYHTVLPQGRYPIAVLMIDLPPEEVDVNVHPTKAEVRFRSPDAVFSIVQRSVREAILGGSPIPTRPPNPSTFNRPWEDEARDLPSFNPRPQHEPRVVNTQQLGLEIDVTDPGHYAGQNIPPAAQAPALSEEPDPDPRPRHLPPMRIVGQVAATYVIAEGPAGLYLIDQHAAHERILYEVFMQRHAENPQFAQYALETSVVEVPSISAALLEESLPILAELGFDIEPFGAQTFRVRAVPALLADHNPADILYRVLYDLEAETSPGSADIEAKLLRRVCKTAAIKAGQILSYDEMLALVKQLERCENPLTCPHGRPTLIHLSANDLAKEFGRT